MEETMIDSSLLSCRDFAALLGSAEPAPGGGGAAALTGALGAALGEMVGSLSRGKASLEPYAQELEKAGEELERLRLELLDAIQGDAKGFLPLAAAYRISKEDPQRSAVIESASQEACAVPLRIMELCVEALEPLSVMAQYGSKLARSDAGCAAALLRSALEAGGLNLLVNSRSYRDKPWAKKLEDKADKLLGRGLSQAGEIYRLVYDYLAGE